MTKNCTHNCRTNDQFFKPSHLKLLMASSGQKICFKPNQSIDIQ